MALLTRQEVSQAGLNPSFGAAAAGGDSYPNDDRTFFVCKNGHTAAQIPTLAVQRTTFDVDKLGTVTFAAIAVSVPASGERWIKAPVAPYNDVNGRVQVTYDAVVAMTVAAIRVPSD